MRGQAVHPQVPSQASCCCKQDLPAPSPLPASRQAPLTVADVMVGVADAQVAPAVLHAVAAVGALCVHVAGCGCDLCTRGGGPGTP